MKITYFHQYFRVNSGGTRSYEFSKYLVDKNYQVTMITGENAGEDSIDGINIKSTNTKYKQGFSFYQRIYSFLHFMIKATIIGLKDRNTDLVYATSTPLTIGIPALIVSKIKKVKYVFEVRDVWPDVPIELGYIKSGIMKKILFSFEKLIYKHASHIITLSDGMKENLISKGIPKEKITVITNLSMNKYYDSTNSKNRKDYPNKLLCIHPGTMGVVNGLDFILDIAKSYPDKDIIYLLIGEGNQKKNLINRIRNENIKNVIIQDSVPKAEIIKKIKEADVGIMTVANYNILKDNSANKFFDFLAAGLPVLINYEGWQKKILEESHSGKGFAYEDKESYYKFLVQLKNDKKLLMEYSNNAKKLAVEKYDFNILANKLEKTLINALKQ